MVSSVLERKNGVNSLKNEIENNLALRHKNIARLLEFHETEKLILLIFEYLEGPTLQEYISHPLKDINEVRDISRGILEGLKHLKDNGIIHRDIKPENIMFEKKRNFHSLKILDFGLSAKGNQEDSAIKICGTPGFMAPELFSTRKSAFRAIVNPSLDTFSTGATLYMVLFGVSPFGRGSGKDGDLLSKNQKGQIEIGEVWEMATQHKCNKALDLVRALIEIDPSERISVDEALAHPFFGCKGNLVGPTTDYEVAEEKSLLSEKIKEISKVTRFRNTFFEKRNLSLGNTKRPRQNQ